MKLKFVYGILPCIVHYTDKLPEEFGGITNAIYVRIRPKYRADIGLLAHELVHVKQVYRTLLTHGFWYLLFSEYRLRCELEAYAVQASKYTYDPTDWMADAICSKYNIKNFSKQQIITLLKQEITRV